MVLELPRPEGRCVGGELASLDCHIVVDSKVAHTQGHEKHHVARMVAGRGKEKDRRVAGTSVCRGGLMGSDTLP